MNELEKTRSHIQRMGTVMYRLCRIGLIVLAVLMVVQAGLSVAVLFSPEAAGYIGPHLENNFLFKALKAAAGLEAMESRYQAAIGCVVLLISYFTVFVILKMFLTMFEHLAGGERPFDVAVARKIRRRSFYMFLFLLYNPVLAVISFSLVLFFSYLMEYGGYIQQRADETNRIQEEMIMSFAEITENKSGQTGQHIKRVSEYSKILAQQLGLSPEEVEKVRIASTMHDVGKLLIPSEILEKPGKLTDEEYATIKTHTTMGGQLLNNVEGEEMQLSRTIALQHHERYDGKGYPDHIQGDEISLEGRIVAVADVYDALTSRRSYKNAWKEEDACNEILKGRGTQFDPQVVDAFAAAHDRILEVQEMFRDE
ncbi:MAG: HD-GYP domain-containing protein [Oscillospiraceae bacterium]|nr:HD-GYP domain-containing protein [Oscillospiraceae bacterium]